MSVADEQSPIRANSGDMPSDGLTDVTRTVRVYFGVAVMSGLIGLFAAVIGGLFSASAAKQSMAAERDARRELLGEQRAQESRVQRAVAYTKFLDAFSGAVDAVNHVGNCRRGTRQECSGVGPAATVARVEAQRAQWAVYAYGTDGVISVSSTMLSHLGEAADAASDVRPDDTSTAARWLEIERAMQGDVHDFSRIMCRDVSPVDTSC